MDIKMLRWTLMKFETCIYWTCDSLNSVWFLCTNSSQKCLIFLASVYFAVQYLVLFSTLNFLKSEIDFKGLGFFCREKRVSYFEGLLSSFLTFLILSSYNHISKFHLYWNQLLYVDVNEISFKSWVGVLIVYWLILSLSTAICCWNELCILWIFCGVIHSSACSRIDFCNGNS